MGSIKLPFQDATGAFSVGQTVGFAIGVILVIAAAKKLPVFKSLV